MDVAIERLDDAITLIRVSGDLDLYNASRLKEDALRLWEEGRRKFIVDLETLDYIDSSGIGVLIYLYTSSKKRNAHVWYVNVLGSVLKVITLTKLIGFLPLAESLEDAQRRLGEIADEAPPTNGRRGLIVDDTHRLQQTDGMYHKTFYIDFTQIRRLSNLIAQQAPPEIQEINMLEQQISEIVKNAVKHGNSNDRSKAIKVWFSFSATHAHLIVEDEGEGFQELERWNEFYRKKLECYEKQDFEEMMNYLTFRT
ncbi:MAG: anti-sigma factor antagonist, partial [Spirochaetota bacterium]